MNTALSVAVKTTSLFILLVLAFASLAGDKVYKHVDEDGTVHYSDSPKDPSDEALELPPANTLAPPSDQDIRFYKRQSPEARPNYQLQLTSPVHDSTITPGQQSVSVSGNLTPKPEQSVSYELLFDGQVYGQGGSPSFTVTPLYRGTHTLQLRAIDPSGKTLATSQSVSIHVIRPTVLN